MFKKRIVFGAHLLKMASGRYCKECTRYIWRPLETCLNPSCSLSDVSYYTRRAYCTNPAIRRELNLDKPSVFCRHSYNRPKMD